MNKICKHIYLLGFVIALTGCSSVKIPEIKLPEFREDADNVGDYPSPSEAPLVPTDIRNDKAWDTAAKEIIDKRDSFTVPEGADDAFKTEAEIQREMQALKAKVKAYKADDPPKP